MASRENSSEAPESSSSIPRMFYCHQCQARTSPDAEHIQNFTCQICDSGFIEDVTIREDSPSSNSEHEESTYDDLDPMIGETIGSILEGLQGLQERGEARSDSEGGGPQMTVGGVPGPRRTRHRQRFTMGGNSGNPMSDQFIHSLLSNLLGAGRGGPGGGVPGSIHIATSGGGPGGMPGFFQLSAGGPGGPVPMMPLYGNPGDYAWGRGGLDAIVTQLLNQMEGTGPPPMNTDEIKKIPTIKIDQTHIDAKLQCSVCWDDFKLDEEVRQLKCEHIFHSDCIIPWLELHNTCPVCRQEQEEPNPNQMTAGSGSEAAGGQTTAGGGGGVSATASAFNPSSTVHPSTSGNTASGTHVHAGTVSAAEQLAATLGSTISVFNQFFGGVPSQQQGPHPHAAATATTTSSSTSSSSSSTTTSSSTSTSVSGSSSSQSRTGTGGGGGSAADHASGQQQPSQSSGENNSTFQDMDLE